MGFFDQLPNALGMQTPQEVYDNCQNQPGGPPLMPPIGASACSMESSMYHIVYMGVQFTQLALIVAVAAVGLYACSKHSKQTQENDDFNHSPYSHSPR